MTRQPRTRHPQHQQRREGAHTALQHPLEHEGPPHVSQRRADQLHDLDLVSPCETRELDHIRDGQRGGHDQHQGNHQPDTAQEPKRRSDPLDPGLVEPHLLDTARTL